jgi:hypothetical protein
VLQASLVSPLIIFFSDCMLFFLEITGLVKDYKVFFHCLQQDDCIGYLDRL